MEGFWSLILSRTPKQGWFFFPPNQAMLQTRTHGPVILTDSDASKRFGIFSFQCGLKTSQYHFSLSSSTSWPLLISSPSLLSFPPGPSPRPRHFSLHSITEHCFDFPGSAFLHTAYRPACRTAGRIPGLWLSTHISFPHTYTPAPTHTHTHAHTHTHTHTQGEAIN